MTNEGKIFRNSIICGLIAPIVIILILGPAMYAINVEFFKQFIDYQWNMFFTFGILSSLSAQIAVTYYFVKAGLFKSLKEDYTNLSQWTFGILILVSVASLITMPKYVVHITFTIIYLLIIVLMDILIYRAAPCDPSDEAAIKLKICCKQLLYIDGVALVILLFWVAYLYVMCGSQTSFCFMYDMRQTIDSWITNATYPIKDPRGMIIPYDKIKIHDLRKPIMGGIIGFHMFITMFLVILHLYEWILSPLKSENSNNQIN